MFNVCPGCGEYTDAKEIINPPGRAICTICGYERQFLSLPLFVITGASGSGKTTVALELVAGSNDFVVLDQDITAAPPPKILQTKVLRTVVGGKTVYEAK